MMRCWLLLCLTLGGHGASRSYREGTVDMSEVLHYEADEVGAVCDQTLLQHINCDNKLWDDLLAQLCRHCSRSGCVSDPELEQVARMAFRLYITMVERGQENLDTFACKHGLFAALLFHSESCVRPKRFSFKSAWRRSSLHPPSWLVVQELYLRKYEVPLALVETDRLEVTDASGFPVSILTDDSGGRILETVHKVSDGGPAFPLNVRYVPAGSEREFLNVKRHMSLRTGEGRTSIVTMDIDMPVMSLSPFPFHTAKLKSLRFVGQDEYARFVTDLSGRLADAGIFHLVVDGDYTLRYWEAVHAPLREENYLTKLGLSLRDLEDAAVLQRFSIFAPLEQRHKVVELLGNQMPPLGSRADRGAMPIERRLVELELGHIQYGEQPFAFAEGLNFRAFCSHCLWVSVYFYVTESPGASVGPGMSVLPLAFWVPCRLSASELLPATHEPLEQGLALVPRPPARGREMARARWDSEVDPLHDASQKESPRPNIYVGTCRQSLQRALAVAPFAAPTPSLPWPVRELLPMHDMSDTFQLSFQNSLEFIMGFRQAHQGHGLERYQDKIELTEVFRQRKLPVPRTFYAAYGMDFDVRPTIEALDRRGRSYVAKASHLCCSRGVFVMDGGIDRLTNTSVSPDEIQQQLEEAARTPFTTAEIDPRCGDWGTVQAGRRPGVLIEELLVPSLPLHSLLAQTEAEDWVAPDSLACHLVWSVLFMCSWEIKVRLPTGEKKAVPLGEVFRDGSCLRCKVPLPLQDWQSTVALLETMLPHTDYVRISVFMKEGWPVINEVEYTTGGLEVIYIPLAREWTMRWLEGYYRFLT
ncbi:MTR1 [Symbiodinium natans]|uniref:MTR1 protein n=1 Tax=Symbiodinium natans TaxID=878477 RepID=A0A812K2T2_9DINO|nr:MTR1 [Symbiodinium natans]